MKNNKKKKTINGKEDTHGNKKKQEDDDLDYMLALDPIIEIEKPKNVEPIEPIERKKKKDEKKIETRGAKKIIDGEDLNSIFGASIDLEIRQSRNDEIRQMESSLKVVKMQKMPDFEKFYDERRLDRPDVVYKFDMPVNDFNKNTCSDIMRRICASYTSTARKPAVINGKFHLQTNLYKLSDGNAKPFWMESLPHLISLELQPSHGNINDKTKQWGLTDINLISICSSEHLNYLSFNNCGLSTAQFNLMCKTLPFAIHLSVAGNLLTNEIVDGINELLQKDRHYTIDGVLLIDVTGNTLFPPTKSSSEEGKETERKNLGRVGTMRDCLRKLVEDVPFDYEIRMDRMLFKYNVQVEGKEVKMVAQIDASLLTNVEDGNEAVDDETEEDDEENENSEEMGEEAEDQEEVEDRKLRFAQQMLESDPSNQRFKIDRKVAKRSRHENEDKLNASEFLSMELDMENATNGFEKSKVTADDDAEEASDYAEGDNDELPAKKTTGKQRTPREIVRNNDQCSAFFAKWKKRLKIK